MPVIVQDVIFDMLPAPSIGGYGFTRKAPKITFEAEAGYKHQREKWPFSRRKYTIDWKALTQAQLNMLMVWLDDTGSQTFYFTPPESSWKGNSPELRLCRVTSEEVKVTPITGGPDTDPKYNCSIDIEEV